MAFLIFRCGACGEAVHIVERPQYRRDQEVMTPLWCEGCKNQSRDLTGHQNPTVDAG